MTSEATLQDRARAQYLIDCLAGARSLEDAADLMTAGWLDDYIVRLACRMRGGPDFAERLRRAAEMARSRRSLRSDWWRAAGRGARTW